MTPVRAVRLAALALVAMAVGCSKDSTGPSDLFAGSWSVTVQRLIFNGDVPPDTGTVTPAPFTLTISKSGSTYTATWPALAWNVTINNVQGPFAIPGSASVSATVAVSGDTLAVHIPYALAGTGCEAVFGGTFQGSGAAGTMEVAGGTCGTLGGPEVATGAWTATRQ